MGQLPPSPGRPDFDRNRSKSCFFEKPWSFSCPSRCSELPTIIISSTRSRHWVTTCPTRFSEIPTALEPVTVEQRKKVAYLCGMGLFSRHVCKPRRVRHIEGASGLRCSALWCFQLGNQPLCIHWKSQKRPVFGHEYFRTYHHMPHYHSNHMMSTLRTRTSLSIMYTPNDRYKYFW